MLEEEADYWDHNNETLGCGAGKETTARNMHHIERGYGDRMDRL